MYERTTPAERLLRALGLRELQHVQGKIEADDAGIPSRAFHGAKNHIPGAGAEVDDQRRVSLDKDFDCSLAPPIIELEADDAIEQIVAAGDPVEHSLHRLVARMALNWT